MSFMFPKPKAPPPPPAPPKRADASIDMQRQGATQFSSYISSGSAQGLQRKASTVKGSLLGGS